MDEIYSKELLCFQVAGVLSVQEVRHKCELFICGGAGGVGRGGRAVSIAEHP